MYMLRKYERIYNNVSYVTLVNNVCYVASVQFSRSVMSNSLRPHGLQHARPPCPSPTPGAYSNLMSIESVIPSYHLILCHPFSSHLQIFPASGSFPMSRFFTSGGPSIGVSAAASILPMNSQDWFPLGFTGWISLLQSCPTLCDPVNSTHHCHGTLQARILEWVAISFSRGTSRPRDRTCVSRTVGRHFTVWATREAEETYLYYSYVPRAVADWLRTIYKSCFCLSCWRLLKHQFYINV